MVARIQQKFVIGTARSAQARARAHRCGFLEVRSVGVAVVVAFQQSAGNRVRFAVVVNGTTAGRCGVRVHLLAANVLGVPLEE